MRLALLRDKVQGDNENERDNRHEKQDYFERCFLKSQGERAEESPRSRLAAIVQKLFSLLGQNNRILGPAMCGTPHNLSGFLATLYPMQR